MEAREEALRIRTAVRKHQEWHSQCLSLMCAENIMSPLARELMGTDFHTRYANLTCWLPFKEFVGNKYLEQVDNAANNLGKQLFDAKFICTHIPSAQLACETVVLALTGSGGLSVELEPQVGGFGSSQRICRCEAFGANLRAGGIPYDLKEMNLDTDAAIKEIRLHKPKHIMLGGTILMFPQPIREIVNAAREVSAQVSYDGAQVLGLIAGKQFQDPFKEGALVICGSTHKTFPGPQGGIILSREYGPSEKRMQQTAHDSLIAGAHPNLIAVLAVVFAELISYGEAYARQTIRNAKGLAEALYEEGFKVLCPEKGFTESHMAIFNVREMGGAHAAGELLEMANIITELSGIPGVDTLKENLYAAEDGIISGLRVGGGENTRMGMGVSEMKEIASFIERVLIKKESPSSVREDVIAFKKGFDKIHYCFDEGTDPFEYCEISKIDS